MLLSKKVIHLTKFLKKEYKRNSLKELIYIIAKPKLIILNINNLFDLKYLCQQSFILQHSYKIKLSTPCNSTLNTSLIETGSLVKMFCSSVVLTFNVLSSSYRTYTLLRSPFVNKKSREQVVKITKTGLLMLHIGMKNILFVDYIEHFLTTKILNSDSVKFFVTKIIRF